MRNFICLAAACLLLIACDNSSGTDAGASDGGGIDGSITLCGADRDCGDQSLFCAQWRCRPGEPGTDARGCINLGAPCEDGEGCDEEMNRCGAPAWCTEGRDGCLLPGDCDGDGHQESLECGGDDCDDDDGDRHPGNAELCDTEGHDEDCNSETVAGSDDGDMDGDGYISAMCCNGDNCGDDCDDSDINVNPGAAEVCDGIDNDCDGVIDNGSLCPGGLCTAGRCDFTAWARGWGSAQTDYGRRVAIDSAGDIYVGGIIGDAVDFGDGHPTDPLSMTMNAAYVVKYSSDGTHLWHYTQSGVSGQSFFRGLAVSPSGEHVYAVAALGGGTGDVILHLNGEDGEFVRQRSMQAHYTGAGFQAVAADETGYVVAAGFDRTTDFGSGTAEEADGRVSMALVRYNASGAHEWSRIFHATGTASARTVYPTAMAMSSGGILVGGRYLEGGAVLGNTLPAVPSGSAAFVAWFDAAGAPTQALHIGRPWSGQVDILDVELSDAGQAFAAGRYSGEVDLGIPGTGFNNTDLNGFIISYAPDGQPTWARSFGSAGGEDRASAMTLDASGSVIVVGSFASQAEFGGFARNPVAQDGFIARYTASGTHQSDTPYASGGTTTVWDVAIGPGNSTAIVGEFWGSVHLGDGENVSRGKHDAFLLRLGS